MSVPLSVMASPKPMTYILDSNKGQRYLDRKARKRGGHAKYAMPLFKS